MKRYRLITHPMRVPRGPWRDSRATAVSDALALGFARRDEMDPTSLRWDSTCEIEEAEVDEVSLSA